MNSNQSFIAFKNVHKTFRDARERRIVHAIEDISIEIGSGEFVTVIGPSGCGKTTLLNMLAGFEHASAGEILPEGRPIEPRSETTGAFSEIALYVLVRRDGTWWLAAGQNTPIRPGGAV